jgi:hypothetical protein
MIGVTKPACKTALVTLIASAITLIALAIPPSPSQAATTRAEYIAQVDPICAATLTREKQTLGGVGGDLRHGRTKQAARKFARTNKVFGNAVDQVATVSPPPADAALIGQWIAMLRAQLPRAQHVVKVLRQDAPSGVINRALKRLYGLSGRTQALVRDYGFTSCQKL